MTGPAAAARLVPDRWAGVVADHVFAGHRVVLDVGFGIDRARLRILARDGVLLRACHAAYSDGIADLAQAAGLSRLAGSPGRPGRHRSLRPDCVARGLYPAPRQDLGLALPLHGRGASGMTPGIPAAMAACTVG
jgi:hypothetical protein